jgi:hypothetical protein
MPVDPTIMHKYGGPGFSPPPEKRSPWPALLTFLIGGALIGGYFFLFRESPPMMRRLSIAGLVLGALLIVYAVHDGYQEDGLLGAIWRWDNPMGRFWSDDTPAVVLILWLLAGTAVVLGVLGVIWGT